MHFAAHHLAAEPSRPAKPVKVVEQAELSTGDAPSCPLPVDEPSSAEPSGRWLGLVVPKRHARRAVTRTLLKRQMRAVMDTGAEQLPPGLWVLRLKAGFDRQQFPSAASAVLRQQVRQELQLLLRRARQSASPSRPSLPPGQPSAPGLPPGPPSA